MSAGKISIVGVSKNSLVDIGHAILDCAIIVDATAVGTAALFAMCFNVVVTKLADLHQHDECQKADQEEIAQALEEAEGSYDQREQEIRSLARHTW